MIAWFDAHCHLSDSRLQPLSEAWVKIFKESAIAGAVTCAAFPDEWACDTFPDISLIRAYGIHPWAAASVTEADWARLETCLRQDKRGLVGEIGLDGLRPVTDGGESQRRVFERQLEIAAMLSRPVILHGAKAWGKLFEVLSAWIDRLPAVMVHGASFAPEMLRNPLFRHNNIWLSFGCDLLRKGQNNAKTLAAAVPCDRLLIETDLPDRLPYGGIAWYSDASEKPLNHPANLAKIGETLAQIRNLQPHLLAQQILQNAHAFCLASQ